MPESRPLAPLQTLSHVLVVGAGLVYLFGFIIVSIFDAMYGIADFSLFRTKVIAVGTVFLILVALGVLVTLRMFSLFGLTFPNAEIIGLTVTPQNRLFAITLVMLSIPFTCLGLAFAGLVLLFPAFATGMGRGFFLIFITVAVTVTLGVSGRKWFDRHPFLFVSLSTANTAAFFFILFSYSGRTLFWFVLWLSLVCLFTLQVSLRLSKPDEMRKTEWERIFLAIIPAVFGIYAIKIYPKIAHQLGGGSPIPIVLHLNKQLPNFDSETVSVLLIDETEQGYYVTRDSDRAMFVARGLVEEVEFSAPALSMDTGGTKP